MAVPVLHALGPALGEARALGEVGGVAACEAVAREEGVAARDAAGTDALALALLEAGALGVRGGVGCQFVTVTLGVQVPAREGVPLLLSDAHALPLPLAEPVREELLEGEAEEGAVPVAAAVPAPDAEALSEGEPVPLTVCGAVAVWEGWELGEAPVVRERMAVGDRDLLPGAVRVAAAVASVVVDAVGEGLLVPLPMRVAVMEGVGAPEGLVVAVVDSVSVAWEEGVADPLGVTAVLEEWERVMAGVCVFAPLARVELDALGEGVPLPLPHWVPVAVGEDKGVGVAEPLEERVALEECVEVDIEERVLVALAKDEADAQGVGALELLEESVVVMVTVGVPEGLAEGVAVAVGDAGAVGVAELVKVTVALGDCDKVMVEVRVLALLARVELEALGEGVPLPLPQRVPVTERVGMLEGLARAEVVAVRHAWCVGEAEPLKLAVALEECVEVETGVGLLVPLARVDLEALGEGVPVPLPETVAVGENEESPEGLMEAVVVAVKEAGGVGEAEPQEVTLAQEECVEVRSGVRECVPLPRAEGDALGMGGAVPSADCEAATEKVASAEALWLSVCAADAAPVGEAHWVLLEERDWRAEAERETLGEAEREGCALGESAAVLVSAGDAEREVVALLLHVGRRMSPGAVQVEGQSAQGMGAGRPGAGQKEPLGQGMQVALVAAPVAALKVPAGQAVAL